MERIPMTAEGHAALQAELKVLKSVERPSIIAAISEARGPPVHQRFGKARFRQEF